MDLCLLCLTVHLCQLYDYITYPVMPEIYTRICDSRRYTKFCECDFASDMSYDRHTSDFSWMPHMRTTRMVFITKKSVYAWCKVMSAFVDLLKKSANVKDETAHQCCFTDQVNLKSFTSSQKSMQVPKYRFASGHESESLTSAPTSGACRNGWTLRLSPCCIQHCEQQQCKQITGNRSFCSDLTAVVRTSDFCHAQLDCHWCLIHIHQTLLNTNAVELSQIHWQIVTWKHWLFTVRL